MQISIPESSQGFVGEHEVVHRETKLRQEPEACYTEQWQASRGKALVFPPPPCLFRLLGERGGKLGGPRPGGASQGASCVQLVRLKGTSERF